MKSNRSVSRKHFLAASAGLAAAPLILPSGVYGAEQQRKIGLIGSGRMGRANILSVQGQGGKTNAIVTALCDVDNQRAQRLKQELEQRYAEGGRKNIQIQVFQDFRTFVAKSGVDAVVIATPDHQHAVNAIACAEAGMDIYLQKPVTYSVVEGQKLIEVVRKNKVILQVGAQQRSSIYFRMPCELVRNGALGKIHTIDVQVPTDHGTGDPTQSAVPENLDYDLWLGPTPVLPYAERRVHPQHDLSRPGWLQIEAYCRGMITGWGSHMYDVAQWALDMDDSGPVEVRATGEFPKRGLFDVHVPYSGEATYANGAKVVSSNGSPGVKFVGEDGWIRCWRGGFEAHDREIFRQQVPEGGVKLYESKNHELDWLQAMDSRKDPVSTVEIGHRSNTVCVLHHISMKLNGRTLKWDPVNEEVVGDPEANTLLDFEHRKGWEV